MRKAFFILIVYALSAQSALIQKKPTIEQAYVERVVKTLSADDMFGRGNFNPGLAKAADFIASEFKEIGLQPLPGQSDYRQLFKLVRVKPENAQVTINDKAIPENLILVMSDQAELEWQDANEDSVAVVAIGASDNFIRQVGEIRKTGGNTLVLVDPAHQEIFDRFKHHYSQGDTRLVAPDATNEQVQRSNSYVFVLNEAIAAPTFQVMARNSVLTHILANVAGIIPGKRRKEEMVIFSGHYDHIGMLEPVNGDSIANGADDDASGTTAVIALAKHFKKQGNNERTLVFVAFAAEEIGGYGSQYFSKQLDPAQVVAMFNIEMIGKVSKFGKNTAWITGFEKSDFGQILQRNLKGSQFTFHADPYPAQNLFYRSDNATLAKLGVPAHSISTDEIDIDQYYHSVDDEFATLDVANMTQVIRAIAQSAKSIITGKDTPTRVDATTLN